MPYPNFHAARLQDPAKFDRIRTTKGGRLYNRIDVPATVHILWGHPRGAAQEVMEPQALRFSASEWTAAKARRWLTKNKVKYAAFEPATKKEEAMNKISQIRRFVREQDVSTASWASVDKSKLPKECFLWVEDSERKTTWHLPYREGAGGIDPETGMYHKAGSININAVRAIMAALAGARTGKPMSVPKEVRNKAEALAKRLKIGKYAEALVVDPDVTFDACVALEEQFRSLRDTLSAAVDSKWPGTYWITDYSTKEVVLSKRGKPGEIASDENVYYKISYKLTKDGAEFEGAPVECRRVTTYE